MELSPPTLTRSPSTPSVSYGPISSPNLVDQQYKLQPSIETECDIIHGEHTIHTTIPSHISNGGWSSPSSMITASTADSIPSIMSNQMMNTNEYEQSYESYSEPAIASYGHNMYAQSNADSHSTGAGSPAPCAVSPYGTPMPETAAFPTRFTEDINEAFTSATSTLKSMHTLPSRHMHSATSFITDVYGSPHGSHSYMMGHNRQGLHQEQQHQQQMNQMQSHQHNSFPQQSYMPHHEVMMPPATHSYSATNAITESLLKDHSLMQRVPRRTPRRLTTKDEANYQCTINGCGKLFSRSYNYKAHLETHDEKREYPFPCQVSGCTKKFVRKTDLQRHTQSVHEKQRNHPCDYCGRKFARKDTLRRHMDDGCSKRFDLASLDIPAGAFDSVALQNQRIMSASHSLPPLPPSQQPLPSLGMSSIQGMMPNHNNVARNPAMQNWTS